MNQNIVLLGKTGHGKSATGNNILGNDGHFKETANPHSETKMIERGFTEYKGTLIYVFDTPGPFDTHCFDNPDQFDVELTCDYMKMLMRSCAKNGVSAFFFVYNITSKFTEEENKTVEILEMVFGEYIIPKFSALIFTHGDNFEDDFPTWCKAQRGHLGQLINKFNERVLLITNNKRLRAQRDDSRDKMIAMAQEIQSSGNTYTLTDYRTAELGRELLLFYAKLPGLKKRFQKNVNDLERRVIGCSSMSKVKEQEFNIQISLLKAEIQRESKDTDELDTLIDQLEYLRMKLRHKAGRCCVS